MRIPATNPLQSPKQKMDLDCTEQKANPPPNAYNIPSGMGSTVRAFTFGQRAYPHNSNASGPDCCTYTIPSNWGDGTKGASLAGRTRGVSPDPTPGPGAYTPSDRLGHGQGFSLSGRVNLPGLSPSRNGVPGPAQYSLPSRLGQMPTASFSGRTNFMQFTKVNKDTANVAPNTYRAERKPGSDSPMFSIRGGRSRPVVSDTPGPGAYAVPDKFGKSGIASSFGIKAQRRGLILDERKLRSPSPTARM